MKLKLIILLIGILNLPGLISCSTSQEVSRASEKLNSEKNVSELMDLVLKQGTEDGRGA